MKRVEWPLPDLSVLVEPNVVDHFHVGSAHPRAGYEERIVVTPQFVGAAGGVATCWTLSRVQCA